MQVSELLLHWSPAFLWAGFIFYLSHQSSPPGASLAPDYIGHILLYGILTLTLLWAVTKGFRKPPTLRLVIMAWVLALLYGITDEVHQSMIPLRDPSLQDLVSNSVGSVLSLSISVPLLRRLRGKWKWIPE